MQASRETVIATLGDIADVDAQRASWISGIGRPIPDPSELGCQLFDDTNLGNMLAAGLVFSRECDQLLRRLGGLFESSSLEGPPAAVLESREWRAIAALARAALECMKAL